VSDPVRDVIQGRKKRTCDDVVAIGVAEVVEGLVAITTAVKAKECSSCARGLQAGGGGKPFDNGDLSL
jgi:hypothetical protein